MPSSLGSLLPGKLGGFGGFGGFGNKNQYRGLNSAPDSATDDELDLGDDDEEAGSAGAVLVQKGTHREAAARQLLHYPGALAVPQRTANHAQPRRAPPTASTAARQRGGSRSRRGRRPPYGMRSSDALQTQHVSCEPEGVIHHTA